MTVKLTLVCDACGKEEPVSVDRKGNVISPQGWYCDLPAALQRIFGVARDACSPSCMVALDKAAITKADAFGARRGGS